MRLYILLAAGGVVGVIARYQIGLLIPATRDATFPIATLLINISGSLLLGFLVRYLSEMSASNDVRVMLTTGLCGGFTTFSAFSFETVELLSNGRTGLALSYAS